MEKDTFYEKIYQVVLKIPHGKVTTYGAIASFLGAMKSARLVGYAMNVSHSLKGIPAHRVVNRNGMLTGKFHFATPDLMQELLESEGIHIKNNKILNFKDHFWIPK